MSFNRGAKRNSFGGRNFNRNSGGGNPSGQNNMRANLMGGVGNSSAGGGGGVNPWESGMMPGRGLLPTPNNNLSLSSPQAQLVIASNLLSNLLRTQQDVQPQVPSLLSLGNTLNNPGPNYGGQQNFGPGRFNDRPVRHPMKNQRPQPYNKMGNRARDGAVGRRGPSAQQSRAPRSVNQRSNGNQNQHRNDKSSKANPASKQNQTAKKEQQEVKNSDKEKAETHVAKSDESEGTEEKKRDWKDEKRVNEAQAVEDNGAEEESKEPTIENAKESQVAEKKTEDALSGGKKSTTRHADSRYAAVPMNQMFCHVCKKHMWDGFSFENHLRGRAHQLMMEKLDESYKLKVDLMRHELRVAEEQRELSLTNSKRRGKKVSVDLNVREYCTMCDLNFFGTLSSHRKSDKHQQLKTFLHPRCFPCMKEFSSRIEYDEHCLTPVHMKSSAQSEEQQKKKKKDKLAKGESEVRTADDEEKDAGPETKPNDKEEELPEDGEYITDFSEDTILTNHRVPSLKHCRQNHLPVGKSMVKEVQGWHCEKCRRFMLNEADMSAHLRSVTHYRSFVQEFKSRTASTTEVPDQPAAEEANSKKNVKEDADDDYEGDWKRRKIDHSKSEDETPQDELEAAKENSIVPKKEDGEAKYDPLEAHADSEEEITIHDETVKEEPEETSEAKILEQDTPVDQMWADIDNDNDPEIGNLIDDDMEDKEDNEEPEVKKSEPEKKVEAAISEPEKNPEINPTVVLNPVKSPPPVNPPKPATPEPATPTATAPTVNTPVVQTPGANTSTVNTPGANTSAVNTPGANTPGANNTPTSKTPRGRGYPRGRGSQRARRSRR